jgi:hypothetical protein
MQRITNNNKISKQFEGVKVEDVGESINPLLSIVCNSRSSEKRLNLMNHTVGSHHVTLADL